MEEPQRAPLVPEAEPDDPVPVFGSWPRIYLAVVLTALVSFAAIGAFSSWGW